MYLDVIYKLSVIFENSCCNYLLSSWVNIIDF